MTKSSRSIFLNECVAIAFPVALLTSVYLLFAGHNQPGGGFIGGLVAGAAMLLRYVAGGPREVRLLGLPRPHVMMGAGVALAGLTALSGWIGGGAILSHHHLQLTLPVLGLVKTSTALPFDIGVYVVVVGMVKMLLLTLGDTAGTTSGETVDDSETTR